MAGHALSSSTASDVGLRRVLGPVSTTCIVVGAIVGVGIFFTPTNVARIAGDAHLALWTWAAGGVVALLVAFCFVFCNSTAILAGGVAIIAMISAENLLVGLALGAAPGVARLARSTALDPGLSSGLAQDGSAERHVGSWLPLLFAGLVPALFAYGGWQHALWVGGEVRNPRRTVPMAIVLGVLVVIAVYLATNWVYLRLLGQEAVASSRAHPRFATPVAAIALLAALAIGLVVTAGKGGIDRLLTGVVLVDAVFFALTGAALPVLRRRRPDAERSVRVPLYPVVPALFVLLEIAIIFGAFQIEATRSAAWIGVAWIVAAVTCYLLLVRGVARRTET
jgi:APA family basic amino acid/polyamine antiporter